MTRPCSAHPTTSLWLAEATITRSTLNTTEMSDQALKGTPTFIDAHVFDITEDMRVTAVGKGESSSVSTKTSAGLWKHVKQPQDAEELSINVLGGEQVYAVKVWLKFEKITKS